LARLEEHGVGTQPGVVVGTQGYLSPEVARGKDADRQSDLFSLGVTIYQTLTLELPFGKQRVFGQVKPPPRPSRQQPRLTPATDAVVMKALELELKERFPTVEAFREEWQRVRRGQPIQTRLRRRWFAPGAFALVILGFVGLFGILLSNPLNGLFSTPERNEGL